jgi:hypothetical protein
MLTSSELKKIPNFSRDGHADPSVGRRTGLGTMPLYAVVRTSMPLPGAPLLIHW